MDTPVLSRDQQGTSGFVPQWSEVVVQLRQDIIVGEYRPGAQLPARTELQRRFRASMSTLQRAFDELKRDGFVVANSRGGTFVADRPPHLSRYGLVFVYTGNPFSEPAGFWTALGRAVPSVKRERNCDIALYDIEPSPGGPGRGRLLRDIKAHRVAGLLFASSFVLLLGDPVLTVPGVAKVSALTPPDGVREIVGAPADGPSFVTRALDYFAERGRRRFAVLNMGPFRPATEKVLNEGLAARGMVTKRAWTLFLSKDTARNVVELLMSLPAAERPDALFIADDNLIEPVEDALLAAGLRVPEDLDIVAHANFPLSGPTRVPMKRLGWDARVYLNTMIDLVDRLRRGEEPPQVTPMPPVFEDEVEKIRAAVRTAASTK